MRVSCRSPRVERVRQSAGEGAGETGVAADVVRIWRRRQQRRPAWVGGRRRVAVGVGQVDRGDRPPEAVEVLRVPHGDDRVGLAHVDRGEHPGGVDDVQVPHGHLVSQRRVELDGGVAGEEQRGARLLRRARGRGRRAERLDLGEVAGVAGRGQRRRWSRFAELGAAAHQQRGDASHPRHGHRQERRGRGPPDARGRRLGEQHGCVAPVVRAHGDQVVGGEGAECDAARLGLAVGDLRKRGGVGGVEGGLRVGRVGHQDLVGGGHRGRLGGSSARRAGMEAVGLVAAVDADHGVVDRRLDESRVERGLLGRLGRVGAERGHGERVPVGNDRRVASRRRGGRGWRGSERRQYQDARASSEPTTGPCRVRPRFHATTASMSRRHAPIPMTVTVTSSIAVARLHELAQDGRDVSPPVDPGETTRHSDSIAC